jgi:hypothetical protein
MGLIERVKILESVPVTGYAWWQVLMWDGRIINEWDMNWAELPNGKKEARLVCPNGQLPTVSHPGGLDGRVFHFNIAHAIVGLGRATTAYVLGVVIDTKGSARVYAWEPFEEGGKGRLLGPFEDTYPNMRYGGPVTDYISEEIMGTKVNS